jgi:hypothetical protein
MRSAWTGSVVGSVLLPTLIIGTPEAGGISRGDPWLRRGGLLGAEVKAVPGAWAVGSMGMPGNPSQGTRPAGCGGGRRSHGSMAGSSGEGR